MSKDSQPTQQSEEVDLGQLFKIIGKGFSNLFNFIGSIFVGLFNVVILLLQHFFKRFFWYAGAVVIGVGVGFLIDKTTDKNYGANMYIETNFNSARQVYENLKEFHQLANIDRDSLELAKRLNITPLEASKLKGFYIEPDFDENTVVEMYSEFYTKLDSLSRIEMTYDRYKESLNIYSYNIHKIGVIATDKFLFEKIEKAFINNLSNNPYLDELVEVNTENLKRQDTTLRTQVQKTDSLVSEYLKIRINESKKKPIPGAGTNLYMGNAESTNLIMDESKIIDKRLILEEQRRDIYKAMVEQNKAVNVLSGFPTTGYDVSSWTDKKKFVIPLLLTAITLIGFSLFGIVKFLKAQENKR
ncbi:MAG: hypothetical protein ACK5MZ_06560 [Aestuariibaculum sp.]